ELVERLLDERLGDADLARQFDRSRSLRPLDFLVLVVIVIDFGCPAPERGKHLVRIDCGALQRRGWPPGVQVANSDLEVVRLGGDEVTDEVADLRPAKSS